jgi:hypothetical protein
MSATAKKMKLQYTANESKRYGLSVDSSGITQGSGSIARLSIPAFRAGDPGPNPGRSTKQFSATVFPEMMLPRENADVCRAQNSNTSSMDRLFLKSRVVVMTETPSEYKKLMEKAKNLAILQSAEAIIGWDMETMMPPKAINLRSQQFAMLSILEHKMSTDPEIGSLLDNAMRPRMYEKLDSIQKRNVYLVKKRYDEQTKLPEALVSEIAKQSALTIDIWKKAKAAKNYAMFRPELEKLVILQKKA